MSKKMLLLLLCLGICFSVGASAKGKKKGIQVTSIYLDKVKKHKVCRSLVLPIVGTIDPSGNSLTLSSPEDSDRAYITISGNGEYLTDLVNFTDRTATVDVSELGAGVYTITVEYEDNTKYIGQFQFVAE